MTTSRPFVPMQSKEINEISAALAAAQAEIENVQTNATNTYFRSQFADLAAVRGACIGPLTTHGIAVTQAFRPCDTPQTIEGSKGPVYILGYLRTQLSHKSGQYLASELPIATNWGDSQSLGGAITYFRRYTLSAMVGLAQHDDDGETAVARGQGDSRQKSEPRPNGKPAKAPAPPSSSAPQIAAVTPPPVKAEAPAPPPTPPPAPKGPERPITGKDLYKYCVNNRVDPQLKGFVVGYFSGRGYPLMITEWTDEQVRTAWPTIRDHLQRAKLAAQAAEMAGAGAH